LINLWRSTKAYLFQPSSEIKMNNKFPNLFSPLKVGSHTYKNRIIAAPIYCGTFGTIPFLSDVFFQAFEERSKGGCAQVTVGETPVDFEYANREPFEPIDYADFKSPSFTALKRAADMIRANGAFALIELSHCGESKLFIPGLKNPIGPMGYVRNDGVAVIAMDNTMMQSVCNNFIACARYMKRAGFDGVMIHAGHGWLLHQFLSARTNSRKDGYGGSLKNRAKFPMRVIEGVRNAMGRDFIIEVRVSGDERTKNGMGIEETTEFCKMIQGLADIIHVSVGVYRDPILSGEFSSVFAPHGLNAGLSEAVRKAVSIPVTVVGGINSPEQAEKLIAEGKCDFVAMARQLTADPEFANKSASGREDDIAPCLRCYKCFPGPLEDNIDDLSSLFGCSVNPEAFYFDRSVLDSKPRGKRNVLVIGGGVAGMEAAVVAADRGHRVTLVEKSDSLWAALDVYKETSKVGQRVVMVGGGLVGCEAGLHLAKNGRDVTIIEMLDRVAQDSYKMHRIGLIDEMDRMLTYRTGLKCTSIKPDGITVIDRENREEFLAANTVIYAVGMRPKKEEAEKLRFSIKDIPVYEIGDCVNAAKVYDAVRQGFIAAMSIL
jgi:2,4-dienoyl-CoA reductase-like NADH-dependent reductase (Old Yellow Enzyme family)